VQACETVVSLGVGAVGAFYLAWPSETARRWALRGVVLAGSGAAAAALGVLAVNLA
jgi:hypothetical protein